MIETGPVPGSASGLWILEGIPLSGKTALLRRWRAASEEPVLWSAEDFATQRLFEPLERRHEPEAVFPWLEGMLEAWEKLQRLAERPPWSPLRTRFTAHQERFHLSARLELGITEVQAEGLETRLARLEARGILLRLNGEELERRLERSLDGRPGPWGRWIEHRFGSLAGAKTAFLEQQGHIEALAHSSCLPWVLPEADAPLSW